MEWVRAMTSTSSHKADVQVQATILLTGKFDQLRAQRLRQRRHFHPLNAASTSAASPSRPKAAMDDETPQHAPDQNQPSVADCGERMINTVARSHFNLRLVGRKRIKSIMCSPLRSMYPEQ